MNLFNFSTTLGLFFLIANTCHADQTAERVFNLGCKSNNSAKFEDDTAKADEVGASTNQIDINSISISSDFLQGCPANIALAIQNPEPGNKLVGIYQTYHLSRFKVEMFDPGVAAPHCHPISGATHKCVYTSLDRTDSFAVPYIHCRSNSLPSTQCSW